MWKEKVKIEAPYHFDRALQRLSLDPLHHVDFNHRTVRIPIYEFEQPVVVSVQAIGDIDQPVFFVSGDDISQKEQVIKRIRHIFQWNQSLKVVMDHFMQTNLKSLIQEHWGTPLVCEFHVYACLMKSVIHQQLNLSFAHTLTTRFVQTYGKQVDGVWFYPDPKTVASLSYDDLRKLQFSQRKAEYVIDTSKLIAEKKLNLSQLLHMNNDEIKKELIKIRGIGPWTIQNLLLFGLGRKNILPQTDIGIQNAMKKHFQLDQKPTKDQMEELSKEWAPYQSYAAFYLWRSIEPK